MIRECMTCRWRSPALTCSLHLIAGQVGESVLWCSHVERCVHPVVKSHFEELLHIGSRTERAERIAGIEHEHGPILAADVRDAFAVAFANSRHDAKRGV